MLQSLQSPWPSNSDAILLCMHPSALPFKMMSSTELVFICLRFSWAPLKVHLPLATGCQAPEFSMDLQPGPYSKWTPSPMDLQAIEALAQSPAHTSACWRLSSGQLANQK